MDWPSTEISGAEVEPEWLLSKFNFEATCFGIGVAMGSRWGWLASLYGGIVAVLWARLRWENFRDTDRGSHHLA